MLQGHAFDSFLKPELHPGGAFIFSQFLGGMPPAIFLFLTGVTLAFLMDSSARKGLSPVERVVTAFRRSGYLFGLAFAFRLQMWLFGFPAPWTDLFKVDILNAMGFAIGAQKEVLELRAEALDMNDVQAIEAGDQGVGLRRHGRGKGLEGTADAARRGK